jgi:hypothetical protein
LIQRRFDAGQVGDDSHVGGLTYIASLEGWTRPPLDKATALSASATLYNPAATTL